MNFDNKVGVAGVVGVTLLRGDGSVEKMRFKNLITNTGLDLMSSGNVTVTNFMYSLSVGTGTATPQVTDSALQSRLNISPVVNSSSPTAITAVSGGVATHTFRKRYQYALGAVVGNITELGLSTGSQPSSPMNTRALFTDSSGSPITVTVRADDQLIIDYDIIFTINTADRVWSGEIVPGSGVVNTVTMRPMLAGVHAGNSFSRWMTGANDTWVLYGASSGIGPSDGVPTGTATGVGAATRVPGTYVPGSGTMTDQVVFSPADMNYKDIGAISTTRLNPSSGTGLAPINWQIGFVPRLTKTSLQTFRFNITSTYVRL